MRTRVLSMTDVIIKINLGGKVPLATPPCVVKSGQRTVGLSTSRLRVGFWLGGRGSVDFPCAGQLALCLDLTVRGPVPNQ